MILFALALFFLYLIWIYAFTVYEGATTTSIETAILNDNNLSEYVKPTMVEHDLAGEIAQYKADVNIAAKLQDNLTEQATNIIAGMDINEDLTTKLTEQRMRNKKLLEKLIAKEVEFSKLETNLNDLQNEYNKCKMDTTPIGSIAFPKQVLNLDNRWAY